MIAIDCETHLLLPEGKVRTFHDVPQMVCLTWCDDTGNTGLIEWDDPRAGETLRQLIGLKTVLMHNCKFDLAVISKWRPDLTEYLKHLVDDLRILDTMVLYATRYPLKDKLRSLGAVVKHLFRQTLDKGSVRTSFRRGLALTSAQRTYAIDDTVWTMAVAKRLLEMDMGDLAREEKEFLVAANHNYNGDPPERLYSAATAYLAWFLEPEGLPVNQHAVDAKFATLSESEDRLCATLYVAGLMRPERCPGAPRRLTCALGEDHTRAWRTHTLNPLTLRHRAGSQKNGYHVEEIPGRWVLNTLTVIVAFERVAEAHGLTPPKTPTGVLSLDHDYWKEYAELLSPDLQAYLELSKVRKYKSSFVGPLHAARPERVYPHYRIPGAETFRWASYRPNQQNQPKALRNMLGGPTLGADYKSLECFTLAHAMASLGIHGPMAEVLKREDFHAFTAQEIGVERGPAKVATFGLGGGMGNKRFFTYMRYQNGLDVTYDQACDVRTKWLRYFTDVRSYLDLFNYDYFKLCPEWCSSKTWLDDLGFDLSEGWPSSFDLSRKLGGKITCVLPSGRVIPQRTFSQAANIFFQGTGADVMTQAFVDMCRARLPVSAVVHDAAYTADLTQGPALTDCMHEALVKVCPTVETFAPRPVPEIRPTFF